MDERSRDIPSWCVVEFDRLVQRPVMLCQRCQERAVIGFPVTLSFFTEELRLFSRLHSACKPAKSMPVSP